MKKEINLLPLLLLAVAAIIAVVIGIAMKQQSCDELTEVRIEARGTMMYWRTEYALVQKDGVWIASYNDIDWGDEESGEKQVDDVFANRIKEILKENKAHKWDEFNIKYEIEKQIGTISTDGIYYGFTLRFSDGSVIEDTVYNAHPESFSSVMGAFKTEFDGLFHRSGIMDGE